MHNPRFLVIGSNSFSGSNFANIANRLGFDVIGISRSDEPHSVFLPYKWNKGSFNTSEQLGNSLKRYTLDLRSNLHEIIELIDDFKPTHIVNFASQGMVAESWLNPTHWYRTNVVAQVALHDELRKKEFIEKYVHITTPEVYGSTDGGWITESNNFAPSTPYAVSRAACDMHLISFFNTYGFPVVFTRAANVYGPGQQLYRIIPRTLLSMLTGKPMELHGGGVSERSFIHIEDVVSATIKLSLEADPGTSWHISTRNSITIEALVRKIALITGSNFGDVVRTTSERLGKDQSYLLDSTAIRESFGWEDKITLNDGLASTLEWVRLNLSTLQKLPWQYIHKT